MRTDIDLDEAAKEGVINEHQAIAVRNFQAECDGMPLASAEKFRLFGGYAELVSALGMAMGTIMAGAFLLLFNWSWIRLRIALLALIPAKLEAQLPHTSLKLAGQRPTRRPSALLRWRPTDSD